MSAVRLRRLEVSRYRIGDWRLRWLTERGFRLKVRGRFVFLEAGERDAEKTG